ncbi:MAG TPA: serine hydrolase, partial [Sphingobacteriaceae bacterium]
LLQIAWRPVRLNNGVTKPYGFGWQISGEGNGRRIGHGGTIDGFQSFAWYVPESKIFVVILSNNMGANPGEYANEILSMMK